MREIVSQICWWTSHLPIDRERHEVQMEREARLKHRVREGGREYGRRAGRGEVMQNEEETLKNLNSTFAQASSFAPQ